MQWDYEIARVEEVL